jgi:hypothetical protein
MSNPWYPVVGALEPVTSAVEPVPGSGVSVSPDISSDVSPESASVPLASPAALDSAAKGPVWPEAPGAPQAVDAEAPVTAATEPDEDPAASSGVWPEPPTPWVDSGAIAAVGAAVASGAAEEAPAEAQALKAAATPETPDVSELPTVVNAPQAELPPVAAAPEPPPAYAPPPPPPSEYPAPSQPLYPQASAYVAPQVRPGDNTPVIVEAILAFFGFYGIGWLIARETTIGVILLVAGFVWDAIFIAAAVSVIGLCCVVPLQLIFVALSAFQLNNRLRMRA